MKTSFPLHFRLEQNFPNSFDSANIISYKIQQNISVNIKINDLTGREISVLINEFLGAGTHESIFNRAGISRVVNFIR